MDEQRTDEHRPHDRVRRGRTRPGPSRRDRVGVVVAAAGLPLLLAVTATGVPSSAGTVTATTTSASAPAASTTSRRIPAPTVGPLALRGPASVVAGSRDGRAWTDLGLRLVAGAQPVEVWAHRTAWDRPITGETRVGGVVTALEDGAMRTFNGLSGFLKVEIRRSTGALVRTTWHNVCLNQGAARVRRDAPSRAPYPTECPWHPFTVGSVQGLEAGWAVAPLAWEEKPPRLRPGRYRVTSSITPTWVAALGLDRAETTVTTDLEVTRDAPTWQPSMPRRTVAVPPAEPAGREPAQPSVGAPTGPLPDLQSLPAFGMRISRGGNHLQFSANVWNSGDSPLVVDGFRGAEEDAMDGYQYFFDAQGQETGHAQVGTFRWHAAPTHDHWHFLDFARYRLLDAEQGLAVRSRKESFCVANTDGVDYTVPGADWRPEGTDLRTACGAREALSLRQVLSSGSGDTYEQFRAGQSFDLRGLPNGTYLISVEANPEGVLHEQSSTNNASLREVRIGGRPGARTVTAPRVGVVDDDRLMRP